MVSSLSIEERRKRLVEIYGSEEALQEAVERVFQEHPEWPRSEKLAVAWLWRQQEEKEKEAAEEGVALGGIVLRVSSGKTKNGKRMATVRLLTPEGVRTLYAFDEHVGKVQSLDEGDIVEVQAERSGDFLHVRGVKHLPLDEKLLHGLCGKLADAEKKTVVVSVAPYDVSVEEAVRCARCHRLVGKKGKCKCGSEETEKCLIVRGYITDGQNDYPFRTIGRTRFFGVTPGEVEFQPLYMLVRKGKSGLLVLAVYLPEEGGKGGQHQLPVPA